MKIFHKLIRFKTSTSNPFGVFLSVEQEYQIKVGRGLDKLRDIKGAKIFHKENLCR